MTRAALCLLLFSALAAAGTGAASNDGPWLKALQSAFLVIDVTSGDLDGDGKEETALCYEDPQSPGWVGVAVLRRSSGGARPAFHAVLELTCAQLKIAGGRLGIKQEEGARGPPQVVWKYGEDLVFLGDDRHPLSGISAEASSTLLGQGSSDPARTLDGELATTWAEGAAGTGIGETLTFKLPRKTHVAYVGLYGGHGASARSYYDHNRIHRASIQTQTPDDLGDAESGIDFADLGLDIGGDRVELSVENRPEHRFVRVDKKDVMQLELRIESVYLGRKGDDTHVAEVEIVPLLPHSALVAMAAEKAKKGEKVGKGPAPPPPSGGDPPSAEDDELDPEELSKIAPGMGKRGNKVLEELDSSGRSLVDEDDF